MSFCFLYNVVLENFSVQNSSWGKGVYNQLKVYNVRGYVNSELTSHQQQGHMRTGRKFKVSSERQEKRAIDLPIPGLVVQRVIHYPTADPALMSEKLGKTFIPIMPPIQALLSALISSNYSCLEPLFMVPKVFEPLKIGCILLSNVFSSKWFK